MTTSHSIIDNQINQLKLDKEEVNSLIQLSKTSQVQALLNDYLTNLDLVIKDTEKNKIDFEKQANSGEEEKQYVTVSRFSWVNNKKTVKVYLTDNFENIESFDKEKVKVVFEPSTFEIKINDWKDKNWKFVTKNMYYDYDYKNSSIKLTKTGIIVTLKKLNDDEWHYLMHK